MKFLFAFLLVVASVQANSLHRHGWTSGKESVYKFESQVLHGIPEINQKLRAGVQLESLVRVQSFSDYSLRIKLENPKFYVHNEELSLTEFGRIKGNSGRQSYMTEELKKYLEQPFLVYVKSGVIQKFKVDQGEPSSVTNIKRSILSQLQLDVAGTHRTGMESNHIQISSPLESEINNLNEDSHPTYFHTKEESIHGKCKTSYMIQRIPEYKAKEFEEQWAKEKMELRGEWSENTPEVPVCQGKPYYQIIKNKNFDECEVSPVFQKWTGVTGKCNLAKPSTCAGLLLSLSTSTYVICGELSQYHIRNIKTENIIKTNPLAYTTEENVHSTTYINLDLLKVKPITERLPLPSQMKEKESIIYSYPKQEELKQKIPEEIKQLTKEILGVLPVLPQPTLEEPPKTLIPVKIPKSEIKNQIKQQLEKMATEIIQSPESCSSKSDIAGTLISVIKHLRALSLSELQQLKSELIQESGHVLKPVEKLFWDAISAVGTPPSTMLVIKQIKEKSLPINYAVHLIQHTIRNVRYPTQQLLSELVSLAKHQSVKSSQQLLAAVLPNLSSLFYRAYVNPSTLVNNFPVQIYGVFGSKNSPVLVEKYLPYLISIAKGEVSEIGSESARQFLQYNAIVALGKTGHLKSAEPLLKIVEGKIKPVKPVPEESPFEAKLLRPLAVHSLQKIGMMNPPQIKPLLMAIIENPVEAPEVRTAAVAILPFVQPNPNDIQSIALRTWFEPSKQVANFIRSTLYSLVNTEIPEFKPMSGFVKVTLPIMKPHDAGYIFARNMHFNQFVEYLQTGIVNSFQLSQSRKSLLPTRVYGSQTYFGQQGTFAIDGGAWAGYMQGMDELVERYIKYFTFSGKTTGKTNEILKQIVEKLSLKKRGFKEPQFFGVIYGMGIHQDYYLDNETVMKTLEKISDEVNQGEKSYNFNMVSGTMWQESTAFVMTDAGFPIVSTVALPLVISARGHVRINGLPEMSGSPRPLPELEVTITPVVNVKVQSTMEVLSPLTKELVGTGVEASVHSSIPLELKAKMEEGELQLTIKTPSENTGRQTETLHGFVLPFTYVRPLFEVRPVTKSRSFKRILSSSPRVMEMDIGRPLGLSAKLYLESNNHYNDFASYIEKIGQTSLLSLPSVFFIPSSVRYSSTRIRYSPSQSETKELVLRLKLRNEGSPLRFPFSKRITDQDIEPEFTSVKSVLEKIRSTHGKATLVTLTVATNGQSNQKSLKSSLIIGKSSPSNVLKTFTALNFKMGQSGTYSVKYEGEASFTNLKNLWNLEQLVQEELEGKLTAKLQYGQGEQNEIVLKGLMKKSEEQKRSVQESPEYKKCQQEMQEGRKLSPICREVRVQAASLDEFKFEVERYPSKLGRSTVVHMVKQLLESYFLGQITYNMESGSSKLLLNLKVDRTGHVAQGLVQLPTGEELKIKNIRLYGYPKYLLPLPIHTYLGHSLKQSISNYHVPYTCTVEPKTVTTFDNRTYGYKLNDCEHLLLQDGGMKIPIAVLAKSVESGEKKEVRIISGEVEVKVVPQGESVSVKVNNDQVELPVGQIKVIKSSQGGYVTVEMKKYQEGTCWLNFPQQGLEVLVDGKRIEILSTGLLFSRAVGICGDMNTESAADLKSPKKCVMTPKIGAVSYILEKEGGKCQGIPSMFKEQYEKEVQKCLKEVIIPTPVEKIYQEINQITIPLTRTHVVEKLSGMTCISKHMVNICHGKPVDIKYKTIQFACIPRPSVEAQTLEKRALAGEPLSYIVEPMPTFYSKTKLEPMC